VRFFLYLSHRELFGLPALEAMASGCLATGFHVDGGRDYMNQNNSWWEEDGDWLTCVNGLASAIKFIDTVIPPKACQHPLKKSIRKASPNPY